MYFNEELSKEYGLVQSILLQHFAFWINFNKQNELIFMMIRLGLIKLYKRY